MRRWGLHGVTKFLDKDPSDDITRGDGAGIMDYSRAGHLSTAWWTFSLSFSLIIARLLTAVWNAFSRLASLVGTSLPRVGCLVPVWHYKCLKVLSLGRFSWSTLALSNRNSKESQPFELLHVELFPSFVVPPKPHQWGNQDGLWYNSNTKWVVLLGGKEAWALTYPARKGIKGAGYWAASTCLVEALWAWPHAHWATEQSSLCVYSGTHSVWRG